MRFFSENLEVIDNLGNTYVFAGRGDAVGLQLFGDAKNIGRDDLPLILNRLPYYGLNELLHFWRDLNTQSSLHTFCDTQAEQQLIQAIENGDLYVFQVTDGLDTELSSATASNGNGAGNNAVPAAGNDTPRQQNQQVSTAQSQSVAARTAESEAAVVPGDKADILGESIKAESEVVQNSRPIDLNNITPNDVPSFKSGDFNKWFDARTPEELAVLYQTPSLKNKISDGLRGAGGKHEFMMVVEAPQWSKWGVTAQQVQEDFAIPISTLNEGGLAKGWKHSTGIKGSKAPGSKTAHNELQTVIQKSNSLSDYRTNMRVWAEKWINGGYDALPSGFHN